MGGPSTSAAWLNLTPRSGDATWRCYLAPWREKVSLCAFSSKSKELAAEPLRLCPALGPLSFFSFPWKGPLFNRKVRLAVVEGTEVALHSGQGRSGSAAAIWPAKQTSVYIGNGCFATFIAPAPPPQSKKQSCQLFFRLLTGDRAP